MMPTCRLLPDIISIINTMRRYLSIIICAKLVKRQVFANVLGIWHTREHGRAEKEYPLPPLEGGGGPERVAFQAGRMARHSPPKSGGLTGRRGGRADGEGEESLGKCDGAFSRRFFRGFT